MNNKLKEFESELAPHAKQQKYLGKAFICVEKASMT